MPITLVDHASEIIKLNILCNLKQKIGFHASFDDYTKLECHRDIGKVKLDLVCFASFVVVVFGCYLFAVVAVVLVGRGRRGAGFICCLSVILWLDKGNFLENVHTVHSC